MDFCGRKIKLWKPSGAVSDVTLRDLPAEGTFLAMQKEIRGITLLVQVRFLPRMWQGKVASTSLAQGGLPTRKRKLRKVCAPESLPKILQVDSLPEVWASLAQRPVLRHSGWFLELLVGRGVLEIKPCFWCRASEGAPAVVSF